MRSGRGLLAACALLALLCNGADVLAQRPEAPEPAVKAAFLYKFANYIDWPSAAFTSPSSPFVIGVVGADEIGAELERIVPGRTVNGHPVTVKRLREGEPVRGIHLFFIGKDAVLAPLLRAARQQQVLAVTDAERALELGSAINFVPAGERIAFEVSLEAADKTGHRISSRMLSVARRVVPRS